MIQILRKRGWALNPKDKVVNNIIRAIEKNNGECACYNTSIDNHCPCTDYLENDICYCTLYIKEKGDSSLSNDKL